MLVIDADVNWTFQMKWIYIGSYIGSHYTSKLAERAQSTTQFLCAFLGS